MQKRRAFGTSLALALLCSAPVPGTSQDAKTCGSVQPGGSLSAADVVFEKAREVWGSAPHPASTRFTIVVRATTGGRDYAIHYQGEDDFSDHRLVVKRFSEEEADHPTVPHGTNFVFTLTVNGATTAMQLSKSPPTVDFFGTPHLSPVYSFGVARGDALTPPNLSLSNGGAADVIGRSTAFHLDYTIQCDDAAEDTLHLVLRPIRDPHRYRLRQMWIDRSSLRTMQIETDGNFASGPGVGVHWRTSFQFIDGTPFIEKEVALDSLVYGKKRRYDNVSISFEQIDELPRSDVLTVLDQIPDPGDLREPS